MCSTPGLCKEKAETATSCKWSSYFSTSCVLGHFSKLLCCGLGPVWALLVLVAAQSHNICHLFRSYSASSVTEGRGIPLPHFATGIPGQNAVQAAGDVLQRQEKVLDSGKTTFIQGTLYLWCNMGNYSCLCEFCWEGGRGVVCGR